ncbi:MAG: histidinol-phosphate transaminase [Nitrospirota bacterium]
MEKESKIINLVRGEVKTLRAYEAPEIPCKIKLDAQENPYPLPVKLRNKILKAIKPLLINRYPDSGAKELKRIIAGQNGVKVENVLLGNGSDELIQAIITTFGRSQGKVLYPVPTFSMYGIITKALGQIPIEIPLQGDFDLDIDSMLTAIKKDRHRVIFLSYPNNPTGNCFSESKIIEIIKRAKTAVVVDEAYFDFSGKTFLPLIRKYENLIILRTLSKIGLAALRIGILIARPEIVKEINKVRLPYNVNSLSQAAARVALENRDIIDKQINAIINERERLYRELLRIDGIRLFPSVGNFILFRTIKNADKIYQGLINRGILIRNMNQRGLLNNCLRVTIGTSHENRYFLEVVRTLI